MEHLTLLLDSYSDVDQALINQLRDDREHVIKISTTKKNIECDRKDSRFVSCIKNVKLIYMNGAEEGGVYILLGNLQCTFRSPWGGSFFCRKIIKESTNYLDIQGVTASVRFTTGINSVTPNADLEEFMTNKLITDPKFEYNIGQFDEFMKIFEFYKKISDELNNNVSYKIVSKSDPYYFIPFDAKGFDSEFKKEVKDYNGVLKGYRIEDTDYINLKNDVKESVRELFDIRIKGGMEEISKIKRVGEDNIYLSNYLQVTEKDIKNLKQFVIVNVTISKDEVLVSGELKSSADYENDYSFLNLYDMGQKIKIESIENSLRLINQGATGAASELLEYLIGDKKMPDYSYRFVINSKMEKYIQGLNNSQRRAFMMAVDGSPVSLIKGPPGTGKTHVINAIVQYITKELGEKVVISSQTHVAIDNVLDKLVENYDLVIPNRITNRRNRYSGDEIDATLYRTWGKHFQTHNERSTNETLRVAMAKSIDGFKGEPRFRFSQENQPSDFTVIGATTTTSAIAGKKGLEILKGCDWLIIDEVSKCPITEVLRYLPYVSKIIMVGDDFQLAPLLEFGKDDVKGLPSFNEEMFDKLQGIYEQSVFAKVLEKARAANRLVILDENYRSVAQVLQTYNFFYDNKLIGKREEIRQTKVQFVTSDNDVPNYQDHDVFFVEVRNGQETKDGTSRFNIEELEATKWILEDLIKKVKNPENVTVSAIFPYGAQINHFQKKYLKLINEAKKHFKSFEIDTVDAFQGKESDIVLVNTVVTDSSQRNFLNDFRRINVSMSRARDKLIVFGNSIVLSRINMKISGGDERKFFKDIIDYIRSNGYVIEYKGGEIAHGNPRKSGIKFA